ncbi:SCO7613 C-terminal domain-containing membrane protein [Paractinoplanes deccanensis]|uniref:SCO7613 C-terminal domain-containing membrane protein n=1 Tax=Paractinoplanes deccanensis TaxID=113561 RepID=UPI0019458970|nr:hypothetical protein [Actinoplanes deccanensis]
MTDNHGPDPDAIEVARADAEISELIRRLAAARHTVTGIEAAIEQAWRRRHAADARMRARMAAPQPAGRGVQTVLFLLGGLLLAVAAVVFTAVAWAQFGDAGRAVVLAGFTAVMLAVPPLVLRRGLTATAETFAAVGVLLTLLDGYAVWHVYAFGSVRAYAAAVCAVAATVAVVYGRSTGLVAPRYAALLAGQPVLPLLAAIAEPGLAGWAFAFVGVAALDVGVLAAGRLRVAACVTGGVAVLIAASCALIGLAVADEVLGAAGPAAGLLGAALVVVAGSVVARQRIARAVAAALLVAAFVVAAGRVAVLASPLPGPADAAAVTLAAAVLVGAVAARLPLVVARGARAGGLAAGVVLAVVVVVATVDEVVTARVGWSPPVALALLVAAAVALVPVEWRRPVALLGAHAVLADAVVLLVARERVTVLEAYTLTAASVALTAGILVRRARPAAGSWTAYGPVLVVALAPSLISIFAGDGQHLRRLLLGAGALVIVLAGVRAGMRAPVLLGGGAVALVALHELAPVWDLLPRWIPLAAAGLVLVALAMTLERRRRELDRFRAVLHRMS